jgi:multidrug efflux pump subunit AcrB
MNKSQEKVEEVSGRDQEKMRAAMSSIRAKLGEPRTDRVEDVLVSLGQRGQGSQSKREATKTLEDTTRRRLETKRAEIRRISRGTSW